MYCGKCGKELENGIEFCPQCGTATKKYIKSLDESEITDGTIKHTDNNELLMSNYVLWLIALGLSVVAAFLFIKDVPGGNIRSYLSAIGAILLVVMCIIRKPAQSMELSIPLSVFAVRYIIVDYEALRTGYFSYLGYRDLIFHILCYFMLALYWIWVMNKGTKKYMYEKVILGISLILSTYGIVQNFITARDPFRYVFYHHGNMCFMLSYFFILFFDMRRSMKKR